MKFRGGGGRRPNIFIDDRGYPDPSDEIDTLVHSIGGAPILRKCVHPRREVDDIDPAFNVKYNEEVHSPQFREQFKPSPLLTPSKCQVSLLTQGILVRL